MTDELGAISVGLKVGLGTLDADLRNIQKKIEPIAKEHSISFKVGSVNVTEVRNQIRTITQGKIPLPVTLTVPANSGTVIRRTLTTQLRAAGPVLVQVTASLRPTDISRIKREIELAMRQAGPVNVPFNTGGTGRGGGGGGGGAPPTGGQPVTPTPRAPRTPSGARGAPEGPSAASAPTAAPAPTATPARPSRGRTAREAREATTASTTTAEPTSQPRAAPTTTRAARATQPGQAPAAGAAPTPRAAPAAAPPPRPTANFGAILPTGAASSVVQRRQGTPDPEALSLAETAETGPRAARFLAHRAQRAAGRTVSLNTLRDDKVHTNVPETPEEIEDASRRWQVRVPMSLQEADAASERGGRGRGTRGARLSGARLPGEPVLTDMDTLARDNIQHQKAEANRAERDAAIRAPARRSGAFYGSRGNNPAFNRMLSGLQYLKFDPVLGEAFGAFERGELGETRALLKGFGGKLAGADPRARSRFFKMLRNSEKNVSGGLLEKHAAFQALITETGLSEAQVTVDRAESAVAAFPKPKGRQADWPEPARDEWQRLIAQRSLVQRTYQNTLRGMRPAKRGDAPRGPTGSSPAHLGGARVGLDDAIRAMNEGRMTRAEFEVKFPGFKEREGGGRVGGYREPGPSEDLDAKWAAPTRLPYRDDMPKEAGGRISEIARLLGPLKAEVDEEGWEKWGPKQKKYAALLHEQDRLHTTWRRREGGGRIEGRERGGTVASGRIHGTRQWRKMSVAQRAAQPFCTYCQTFGTAKNPLQADHIKAIAEGGAPYDPRNITTACAKCNLLKRGQEGWGPPSRAPRGVTGREGGGRVAGMGTWYRGGTSKYKNLWQPGSGREAQLAEGPMATLGSGLYLTDKPGAEAYARVRAAHGPDRGDPIVGAADVLLKPSDVLDLTKHDNALPRDVALDWHDELFDFARRAGSDENDPQAWLKTMLADQAVSSTSLMIHGNDGRRPRSHLHNAIRGFQDRFSSFLQKKGYGGVLAGEGGELDPLTGQNFAHPSLVVFDPKNVRPREGGGPVEGPLQRRIRMAKEAKIAKQAYLVGEKKPEAFIGDSGRIEIVGEDGPEIRVFPESGKVLPYVPEWVRRGMAKDLTGREVGGRVYKGRLAAEEGSGVGRADVIGGGTMKFRDPFEGEKEAIVAGKLSPSGSVQRVWVVNMPAGGFGGGGAASAPTGAMRAAGPTVGRSIDDPFASLRELIEETVEVGQAAPASPRVARARQELLDPAERALGRISSRQEVAGPEAELSGMAHELSEKEQRIPSRGPAVMFGQLFQVLFGGRSTAQTRIKETRDAIGKADQATASWRAEQEKLNNAVTLLGKTDPETHPEAYAEAEKEVDKLTVSTRDWREEQQLLTEVARGLSEKVLTTSSAVRVAATGIAGLAAGTVVFSAVLGATQMALGLVVPAVQAVTDRMGGYQNAANEMTATLAQQIRAQNGSVEATLAQSQAQIGLGANTARAINPLLSQTAMIEAGSMALRDQIALLRAYEGLQQRQGGMTFPRGLVDTQGGLNILGVQTPFGGTPSVLEQLNNELGRQSGVATNPIERLGQLLDPMGPDPEKKIAEINERQSGFDRFIGYDREADIGLKGRPIGEFLFGTEESKAEGKPPPWTSLLPRMVRDSYGTEPSSPPLSPEREKGLARLREAVNEPIERAGGSMKLMSAETDTLRDAQKRQADALKSSGIPRLEEFAERLENSNTVLGGVSSDPVQLIDDVLKGLEDMTRGATIPDVEVLLKQFTERIIPAQKALFAAQGNFQRNQLIPAQFALQSLAAPTPGTGGVPFEAGTVGRDLITGEVDSAAAAAAKSVKSKLGGAVEFINSQIATGRSQLIELASLGGRGAEFTTLLEDIEATGKAISGLQLGIQQRQADLQVSEYNNQLRIARRSLKDIKDTQAGIAGETRNTIGGLEGQNIALQRQLQLLQFSLQQRQINFRLATAGFVAPGTTPEERAARIEAAKEEAAFAQKQLDIQKKIADNQYRSMAGQVSGGNQLQRNIEDLSRQIGLLEEGKKITIQTVVDSRSLDVQNKKMGLLIQQAGTYVEEGTKITQSQMEATADIVRQTGAAFGDVLDATAKAWGIFGTQYRMALMGGAPSKSKGPTSWGNYASGIVGDTLGPTQITVGEAAGEKVAVLKNPKLMPSSILASTGVGAASSGSLIQMTVIISGNSVREDTDLQTLADLVSQKVEDRLMRKTSLFGLRRI